MITGHWYPQGSSARYDAELQLHQSYFVLNVPGQPAQTGDTVELSVSDRVGNIPRRVTLSDGSIFQTDNNQALDQWLANNRDAKRSRSSGWFHILESHWGLICFAAIFVMAFSFSMLKWGVPWASVHLAHSMPVAVGEKVGKHALEVLDQAFLEPSELSEEQQQKIRQHFETALATYAPDEQGYELHFRKVGEMANAFALPSGDIILTDALVEQLSTPQLDSVIFHEMGHIYHRHGLRQVIHNSSVAIILVAIMGNDLSMMEELLVGLPVFLMHQHYTREAETEADIFALEKMTEAGINPVYFAEAMKQITAEEEQQHVEDNNGSDNGNDRKGYLKYVSTHPVTAERIDLAEEYGRQFETQ